MKLHTLFLLLFLSLLLILGVACSADPQQPPIDDDQSENKNDPSTDKDTTPPTDDDNKEPDGSGSDSDTATTRPTTVPNPYADVDIAGLPDGPQDRIAADESGFHIDMPTQTKYTGDELKIELNDPCYGGAQYVGKLFTEGLGRGPGANEYLYYTFHLESDGCTVETLAKITEQFFSSKAFLSLKLAPEYEVMAVYRAVLSRDPTLAEINDYFARVTEEKAAGIAVSLTKTEEFANMLPDIIRGDYYWGANNTEYSPSGIILTTNDFVKMLNKSQKSGVLELEPGTLVLLSRGATVPKNVTVTTKGNPTHYTQQARILRTETFGARQLTCNEGSTISHLWIDGNRSAFPPEELLGGNGAACVALVQNNASCISCRVNGSIAGTHIFGADAIRGLHIADNLVTCYESDHYSRISDGITVASTECLIENNTVIDATDVGIILFRFVSPGYEEPQNSVVRNNTILNLGNSAFAGLDIDAWNKQEAKQNFVGTLFENNALWTSYKAHQHICLSLATLAWHNVIGDEAIGSTMINNYTPDGLHVNCAVVFAGDGCYDLIARGNHINAYIGPWGRSEVSPLLRERISSLNPQTASGDVQGEYEELTTWIPWQPIVYAHSAPPLESFTLKGAIFHENRVTAQEVGHPN